MVKYGIRMSSRFSHLPMKYNVCHTSTCIESANIYALFEITDNFFAHLWPDIFNHMLDFSLELKNSAWFVSIYLGFHKPPQEEITRGNTTKSW